MGSLFGWSLVAREATAGVGISPRAAAAVFATAIVVLTAVLLCVGPALRRWSSRRLLRAAAVAGGGGLLLAASGSGPVALWTGVGLLFGSAGGLAYGVAAALAALVPRARRGAATGLVVAAYAAGPLLLGLVAPSALRAHGWQWCLGVLGATVTVLLLLAGQVAPEHRAASGRARAARGPVRWPRRPVVLLWMIFAGGTAPALVLFAHATAVAVDRGFGAQTAGLAVSGLAAGNLVGRLAGGWWSDGIGRVPVLATALGTAAVSLGCLAGTAAPGLVLAGFLGTGLAYGAVSSLVPATTADSVGAEVFPSAYGWVFTGWGMAGLLAPVAGGHVLLRDGDAVWPLALIGVPLVPAGFALLLLARRRSGVGDRAGSPLIRPHE